MLLCVSEAEAGVGKAAEPKTKTSGGLVSEQEGKVRNFFTETRVKLSFALFDFECCLVHQPYFYTYDLCRLDN